MANKEEEKVEYLGDGLYAKFDGYQICLMANSCIHPTDIVALDPHTLSAFLRYVEKLKFANEKPDEIGEEG